MNLNDMGVWCVVWLNKNGLKSGCNLAWSFFRSKVEADAFIANSGGELWQKQPDGSLKRL